MPDYEHNVQTLLTLTYGNVIRHWWTGGLDLLFDGTTYSGTHDDTGGSLLHVSPIERTVETPDIRGSISMTVTNESYRRIRQQEVGIISAKLAWIWLAGHQWLNTGQSFEGVLSNIRMADGLLTAEIETVRGGAYKQSVDYWDNIAHQGNYPGELGFEFAGQQQEFIWPPVN